MTTPATELAKQPAKRDERHESEATFSEELPVDWESARQLLVQYSGIPASEVESHVRTVRAKAYTIHPYPCIGRFRFLELSISRHPAYPQVLERLKAEPDCTLLDLGCCFAQDLRRLAADGVSASQLYGADLRLDYLNLGYELFRDEGRIPRDRFHEGDIFGAPGSREEGDLVKLNGKVNMIYAASFLHLFDWENQVAAAVRMVGFLKAGEKEALIFGRQVGSLDPGNLLGRSGHGLRFTHDARTFQELWRVVGEKTGTQWEVEASLGDRSFDSTAGRDGKTKVLRFAARRLA